jgi:hypothetical protein
LEKEHTRRSKEVTSPVQVINLMFIAGIYGFQQAWTSPKFHAIINFLHTSATYNFHGKNYYIAVYGHSFPTISSVAAVCRIKR